MTNTPTFTYVHSAIIVNGKEAKDITYIEYSDSIAKPKAKVKAIGAVIPDGSDVICEAQLEGSELRRDILHNVRRIEGEHYECDSITWSDYLPRASESV